MTNILLLTGNRHTHTHAAIYNKILYDWKIFYCRFDTHIDYVFTNKEMERFWQCEGVRHVESEASDHKPVIAYFSKIDLSSN